MKIEIKVKKFNTNDIWEEIYDIENDIDPKLYAEQLIFNFNTTLKSGEKHRELVSFKVIDHSRSLTHEHNWEKQNSITLKNKNGYYDIMKCSKCGITGKRYGLNEYVKRDAKYNAKRYQICKNYLQKK